MIAEQDIMPLSAVEAVSRAEVDIQIKTAKQYPRDLMKFNDNAMKMVCADEETAASCFYAIPRDGKTISGPSIRMAEIVASQWGNLRIASRVIEVGQEYVTAQALCHDLETNVAISKETKRKITTKSGRRFSADMIQVTANAACSVALRDAVFRIVPGAFIKPLYDAARAYATGGATPLATRVHKMIQHFQKMGVSEDQVVKMLQHTTVEHITADDISTLLGVSTAIKEGTSNVDDVFPPIKAPGSGYGYGEPGSLDPPGSLDDVAAQKRKKKPEPKVEPNGKKEGPTVCDKIKAKFGSLGKEAQAEFLQAHGLPNMHAVDAIEDENELSDIHGDLKLALAAAAGKAKKGSG